MDALIIIAFIAYAVFSASNQSKKAKKKHDAREKRPTPPLASFETIERERREKKPPKKKQAQLFDFPEKKSVQSKPDFLPKKKKKAPAAIEETPPRKAPLAPVKKEEHEHQHKSPVQSSLKNRTYAGIQSRYQKAPMEVQILTDKDEQNPQAAGFKLKTDREALIEGIIWNEVLAKPKGLRR